MRQEPTKTLTQCLCTLVGLTLLVPVFLARTMLSAFAPFSILLKHLVSLAAAIPFCKSRSNSCKVKGQCTRDSVTELMLTPVSSPSRCVQRHRPTVVCRVIPSRR